MIASICKHRSLLRLLINSSSMFSRSVTTHRSSQSSASSHSTNQLIKTFNTRGEYERAFHLFDMLVKQNKHENAVLLAILDTCTRSGNLERGRQIEELINQSKAWQNDIRLQTSIINMYMKCRQVAEAERVFERVRHLPQCDVIVYNAMLKGYILNNRTQRCFQCFDQMRPLISPDNVTYILLINACTVLRDIQRGIAIHRDLSSSLTVQHVHLQNALIDFYGKMREIRFAQQVFDEMTLRETSTYNSLMKAYLVNDMPSNVLELFERMKRNDDSTIGPLGFKPDLITFMAVCDACDKLGLFNNHDNGDGSWRRIFSSSSVSSSIE